MLLAKTLGLEHMVFTFQLLPNMGGTAEFGWGPDGPRGTETP